MKEYFDILIEIGRTGILPKEDYLAEHSLKKRHFLPEGWKLLDNEDLINLFRGLVVLEEFWFSSGERIGSTTDTKFVYREIEKRQLDSDHSIGNWAFVLSSNGSAVSSFGQPISLVSADAFPSSFNPSLC